MCWAHVAATAARPVTNLYRLLPSLLPPLLPTPPNPFSKWIYVYVCVCIGGNYDGAYVWHVSVCNDVKQLNDNMLCMPLAITITTCS